MVYDTIPRVMAACFLSRMVFSALTGSIHSLLSTANVRLCAPVSTSSQGTSLGSLAAGGRGGRGVFGKSK